jgi:hypothetical protein
MRKKRLNKSEKATLEKLNELQLREIMQLKCRTQMVIKTATELLNKIDSSGINNHYSMHSDIMRYCEQVYTSSYRLGQLKAMCDDLEYEYRGKKKESKDPKK